MNKLVDIEFKEILSKDMTATEVLTFESCAGNILYANYRSLIHVLEKQNNMDPDVMWAINSAKKDIAEYEKTMKELKNGEYVASVYRDKWSEE